MKYFTNKFFKKYYYRLCKFKKNKIWLAAPLTKEKM